MKFTEGILKDIPEKEVISSSVDIDYALLSWSLMLLSSAFDVVLGGKKISSRAFFFHRFLILHFRQT